VAPRRELAQVDLARVLRKLGRLEDARSVLPEPPSTAGTRLTVALEIADREYDAGNYAESRHWFQSVDLDKQHVADTLRTAASTLALGGNRDAARQLFTRVDQAQRYSRLASELQRRLALDPSDKVAASELQHLQQSTGFGTQDRDDSSSVEPLYRQHCAACHGEDGQGDGRAARFLFPRPRNLQQDRYRLVSSVNGMPTLEDIQRVIQFGIPGTAMRPFPDATREQLRRNSPPAPCSI
jgi:mono/diheme cytochrome c family protein